jgi:hypothetical protein
MKLSEFRKLIREEVRKVVNEEASIIKNAQASIDDDISTSEMNKMFGSFLTVKQGPTKGDYANNKYVVDLNVDALSSLLKSNKDYSTTDFHDTLMVFYKGSDSIDISSKSLPKDVITTLIKLGNKSNQKENTIVTVQIADDAQDDFYDPENYNIPTAIQSMVGKPVFSQAAGENEDVYDKEIGKYIRKVEKVLLAAGQKVVPSLEKHTIEDGAIIFKTKGKITPDMKAKLKRVFQGAKIVDFNQ